MSNGTSRLGKNSFDRALCPVFYIFPNILINLFIDEIFLLHYVQLLKMGRKKIQISRITDERNRQVKNKKVYFAKLVSFQYFILSGDIQQEKIRSYEESL